MNKEQYFKIMETAKVFFKTQMKINNSRELKDFMKRRGLLDSRLLNLYDIGFSSRKCDLISHLKREGFSEAEIWESGLGTRNEDTTLKNPFFNHIVFPQTDGNGNVVGFNSRLILIDKKFNKSHKTSLKGKNDELQSVFENRIFGADQIDLELGKKVYFTEGEIDALTLKRVRPDLNVAALSGIEVSDEFLREMILTGVREVCLVLDNDRAGHDARRVVVEKIWNLDKTVKVTNILTDSKDVNEDYIKRGTSFVKELILKEDDYLVFEVINVYEETQKCSLVDVQGIFLKFVDLCMLTGEYLAVRNLIQLLDPVDEIKQQIKETFNFRELRIIPRDVLISAI